MTRLHSWSMEKRQETDMLVPLGTMILVADGAGMRLLRNQAPIGYPKLQLVEELQDLLPHRPADDRAGRVFESVGVVRHAYMSEDRHDARDKEFATRAIVLVQKHVITRPAAPVIIVSPPRLLGFIRALYPKTLAGQILVEIDKDLAHFSRGEIEEYLDRYDDAAAGS